MPNGLPPWVEILKELGIAGVVAGLLDSAKTGAQKTFERKFAELTVEARAKVWNFILTDLAEDDAEAAEALQKNQTLRQQLKPRLKNALDPATRAHLEGTPYVPGDENRLNTGLAKFFAIFELEFKDVEPKKRWERPDEFRARLEATEETRLEERTHEKEGRRKFFKLLGQLAKEKPEDFDAVIEAVIDDGLEQMLARIASLATKPLADLAPKMSAMNTRLRTLHDNVRDWARR